MKVAIIGHGQAGEGLGHGRLIDACDAVIRMHNCGWQDPKDFGRRYDYGVMQHQAILRMSPNHRSHRFRVPTVLPAKEWWIIRHIASEPVPVDVLGRPTVICPDMEGVFKADAQTNAKPTRGTLALYHAIRLLDPDEIVLYGMDSVTRGKILPYGTGFPHGMPYLNQSITPASDLLQEKAYLLKVAETRRVTWVKHA